MNRPIFLGAITFLCLNLTSLRLGAEAAEHEIELENHVFRMMDGGRGYLGVSIRDIDREDAEALSLPAERGAYIRGVEEESPAEEAGLQEGDVVLEYAGESVWSVRQFQRLVKETPPGREAQLKVWRSGSPIVLNALVGERRGSINWLGAKPGIHIEKEVFPEHHEFLFQADDFHGSFGKPRLGVQVAELTAQMADFLGISGRRGVLILETLPSTPAEAAGLQAGDVILSVNEQEVSGPAELRKSLVDGQNEIEIARKQKITGITVNLDEAKKKSPDAIEM
jgi:serine protease Do